MRGHITVPALLLTLVYGIFLSSCSDTDISSGYGIFEDICPSWEGRWAGPAKSDKGTSVGTLIVNIRQDDECKIKGSAVLQPCIPATAINGETNEGGLFNVATVDGALAVTNSPPDTYLDILDAMRPATVDD